MTTNDGAAADDEVNDGGGKESLLRLVTYC